MRELDGDAGAKNGREVCAGDREAEVKDIKLEILGGVISH